MKLVKVAVLALMVLFVGQSSSQAQGTFTANNVADAARVAFAGQPNHSWADLRPLGAGLVIIGAAIGIGWLARAAVESMARQPEVAANIQTAMILGAALIEGATFFALIIIMLFSNPY